MIIEACWGLGEMIVGGMVTPDSYIVQKSTGEIVDVYQADQEEKMVFNSVIPAEAGIHSR